MDWSPATFPDLQKPVGGQVAVRHGGQPLPAAARDGGGRSSIIVYSPVRDNSGGIF
jgi:hypothetical protein